LEADISRLQERRDGLQIAAETDQAAAEEARATLQKARAELGQISARVDARSTDLTRLNDGLQAAEEQLSDERDRLANLRSENLSATPAAEAVQGLNDGIQSDDN
jgi:chromosome segregation ATPase